MRLQAIKRRCLQTKKFIIINGESCQWMSDAINYYRIIGIVLESDWVQDVFALTNKQMDKIVSLTTHRKEAIFARDYPAIGEAVGFAGEVWAFEQVFYAFEYNGATLYVPEAWAKPANIEGATDYRLVRDDDGELLIAVYNGMFCDALLSTIPANIAQRISAALKALGSRPVYGATDEMDEGQDEREV